MLQVCSQLDVVKNHCMKDLHDFLKLGGVYHVEVLAREVQPHACVPEKKDEKKKGGLM